MFTQHDFDPGQYWEKTLKDMWGLHGVGYLGMGQYYNGWMYKVRKKVFLRYIKPLALNWNKIDILDIGSGVGFYVKLWKMLGVKSITATDITTFAVEQLQKEFPDSECYKLDIGDTLTGEIGNKRYDVISAFDVLFHIVDDNRYQKAFENISKMLRPGGLFIFSDNFLHGETIRGENQVCRSLKDIEGILKKLNFKIKLRVPMFVLMNNPVDSNNIIHKRLWKKATHLVGKSEILGLFLGGMLYPFELLLTYYFKEGPSTELMICEKTKQ